MKTRRQRGDAGNRAHPGKVRRGWSRWRVASVVLALLLLVGLVVGRALLPWFLRDYVNRTLDRSPLYDGTIGAVEVHLVRGAYSIREVRINKTTTSIPVPFFSANRVDFAIQWDALWHGRTVGRVLLDRPEINFVDAATEGEQQTGAGGPWLQMLRDLFPFKINRAIVRQGAVHFRVFATQKPVDVYLAEVDGTIDNLGNIRDETTPLLATVQATALAMDQARLEFRMTLDPFSYRPTFHLALRLLGLDVTRLNDLAVAYGRFDFKRGWLDLVVEADATEGQLAGYVKPLFRDLKIFSLSKDLREDNVLEFFWQALVGAASQVFRNQPRDQLGTLIPFTGDLTRSTSADLLATVGNLLRNAFVRAYLPRLENAPQREETFLHFSPPEFMDSLSPSDSP